MTSLFAGLFAGLLSGLVHAAVVSPTSDVIVPAAEIDKPYLACVQRGADNAARAACLNVALPAIQQSLTKIAARLSATLAAGEDTKTTGHLFDASWAAFPPSRDADCRLQADVTEGGEDGFRECVYNANKKRLVDYERFLHYSVEN